VDKKYLTISALTDYIKHKLDTDQHLQRIFVQGEISDYYYHKMSGHIYLTLKDENAQIRAVMYRRDNLQLTFTPKSGMSVFVTGNISVYKKTGQYQLYIQQMEPSGIGALHLAFEQLKEKLSKQQYFAEKYKRDIPSYPKKIAVITSREGAAVRDIITTIEQRYPIVQIVIFPVTVQGDFSADSIVQAIARVNEGQYDTIIVARGGGSLADLASFNDEKVAMAIFHSDIPVITGIGHETDTTISDLVADLRAPTPTGAAQAAVPSLTEVTRTITYFKKEIIRLTRLSYMKKNERVQQLVSRRAFTYPLHLIRDKTQYIDQLSSQLVQTLTIQLQRKQQRKQQLKARLDKQHPTEKLNHSKQQLLFLNKQLQHKLRLSFRNKQHTFAILMEKLSLLNPLQIMQRGYSITYSKTNEVVKSIHHVETGDDIRVQLYDGTLHCLVKEVNTSDDE